MQVLTIEHFVSKEGIQHALNVRKTVFVEEQHIPEENEFDGLDAASEHYVGYIDSQAVSVARVRILRLNSSIAELDRIAVLSEKRGQGFGSQLLEYVITDLKIRGLEELTLSTPTLTVPFFRILGFIASSEEYKAVVAPNRIVSHRTMYRPLA